MVTSGIRKVTYDLAAIVDPENPRGCGPGTSMGVNVLPSFRKPWVPVASTNHPTIWPLSLIPQATVRVAPGTSMVVKVAPSDVRKPCSIVEMKLPTISPAVLIPRA
jgi:hypothetical protein